MKENNENIVRVTASCHELESLGRILTDLAKTGFVSRRAQLQPGDTLTLNFREKPIVVEIVDRRIEVLIS